jgi:hypothetical protein
MKLVKGTTRWCIQFKSIVFKIPSFKSWKYFLHGLINNMDENNWYKFNALYDNIFCKIIFSCPLGLLNVMPYCTPINEIEFKSLQINYEELPVERKIDSFGKYCGRIVAIDYH